MAGLNLLAHVMRGLATGAARDTGHADMGDAKLLTAPQDILLDSGPGDTRWIEGLEDPSATVNAPPSHDPQLPRPDIGAMPEQGAYEGAFRSVGPVRAWGYEDQALGRIMRFPVETPESWSANGVSSPAYLDEIAAALASNGRGQVTREEYTTSILTFAQD